MSMALEFKPRDAWVGIYWKTKECSDGYTWLRVTNIWICLIPCFPIHIRIKRDIGHEESA